jgi:hypothetical protein
MIATVPIGPTDQGPNLSDRGLNEPGGTARCTRAAPPESAQTNLPRLKRHEVALSFTHSARPSARSKTTGTGGCPLRRILYRFLASIVLWAGSRCGGNQGADRDADSTQLALPRRSTGTDRATHTSPARSGAGKVFTPLRGQGSSSRRQPSMSGGGRGARHVNSGDARAATRSFDEEQWAPKALVSPFSDSDTHRLFRVTDLG